jgi:hypothetical protein
VCRVERARRHTPLIFFTPAFPTRSLRVSRPIGRRPPAPRSVHRPTAQQRPNVPSHVCAVGAGSRLSSAAKKCLQTSRVARNLIGGAGPALGRHAGLGKGSADPDSDFFLRTMFSQLKWCEKTENFSSPRAKRASGALRAPRPRPSTADHRQRVQPSPA